MKWRGCGTAVGLCALGLGVGILLAAIFPPSATLFLVALALVACGMIFLRNGG